TSYKYPQMSRDAATPWRARRLFELISTNKKVTMDNVRDAQHDSYNIPVANLSKKIVELNAASPETISILKAWDGRMTAQSQGALLANEIRVCAANKIAADNAPVPAFIIRERVLDRAVSENLSRWLPAGTAGYSDLFKICDALVRSQLSDPKRLGPETSKWFWGRTWQSRFSHPLASVPLIGGQFVIPVVPLDGSGQTPNVGSGVSMRHITSPGNWDATRHVIPLGQSGNPRSPFFMDQFGAWATGTPQIFPFSAGAVEKASRSITMLVPAVKK
ncbi:MAG: penicillin acylase family protein, partial [Pyrinomonadaceae bacterium]